MNTNIQKLQSHVIVYDADSITEPCMELFVEQWWRDKGLVLAVAKGRGTTLIVDHPEGPMAMRRYLRGGWAAKVSRDRYLFTGYDASRPVREYQVLERLSALDLPVPIPVAALCDRRGLLYQGALLTRMIDGGRTMAELLALGELSDDDWRAIGSCISQFHRAGVIHADLNASNIMFDSNRRVHLIDFDRTRYPSKPWRSESAARNANLSRLQRSLARINSAHSGHTIEEGWALLLSQYADNK
jgi:3-deoxy-D-manno-octulosonic acid kinase